MAYAYFDFQSRYGGEYEEAAPYHTSEQDVNVNIHAPSSTTLPLHNPGIELPTFTADTDSPPTFRSSTASLTELNSENNGNSDWSRVASPLVPPIHDPSEYQYELTYRQCLSHDFARSLNVPLWTPSKVSVGDVGYLERPSGQFIRLFNAFKPHISSQGRLDIPGLGNGSIVNKISHRESVMKRGINAFTNAMQRVTNSPKHGVQQTVTFSITSGRCAYLYTEEPSYYYLKGSPVYKQWFRSHWEEILLIYGKDHCLQKEDLILIIECLNAKNFAILVNHDYSDQEAHFNISPVLGKGQDWGVFTSPTSTGEEASYRTKVS
ncbi:hypothetical protein BDZ94DRAFT_1311691 [Collybia nuda]|uniref:Uncharacterized protein n=1 Tax=Collybia nuda TaxID=64659 RepID=A0A9P5Y2Q1_9AGAR|nr:hypothetical protein BDZ94DRAFT_1311691 [Collybia nuda]